MSVTIGRYTDAPASFHEYDTDAPVVASLLADAITAAEPTLTVEHIGSTAVPGSSGKGILDLMILFPPGHLPQAKRALEQLGFQRQSTRDPFPEDRPMRVGVVIHRANDIASTSTSLPPMRRRRLNCARSAIGCAQSPSTARHTKRASAAFWPPA